MINYNAHFSAMYISVKHTLLALISGQQRHQGNDDKVQHGAQYKVGCSIVHSFSTQSRDTFPTFFSV